jgi:eukaryotic-like serine/threonine-protein kinase
MNAGTRLGPYEIISRLGAGGMGEVFKARDTRLERNVAIKILPRELASNAQLRIRFDREAKAISQLNHPHICTLHDIGKDDETTYLVMELIEGETVADRLTRGALPFADVIRYGAEIAEALDSAHRAGVVHRDVKPGNIMITKSGIKLLDFGLAKDPSGLHIQNAETEQRPLTQEGTVLGTVQYMAPEQLAGEASDARSDIFALGAVLYEMTSGKRAFEGKTRTSLVAAILGGDPIPIRDVQPLISPALQRLIAKCLEKDPDERWQSAKDVADELRWIPSLSPQDSKSLRSRGPWLITAVALIVAAAAAAGLWLQRSKRVEVIRLEQTAPAGWIYAEGFNAPFAVSPDGTAVAFAGSNSVGGEPTLWLRNLADSNAVPLAGTEGARTPFWSHDGRSIGFLARTSIKRVSARGGNAETICDARLPYLSGGAAWSANDEIVFSSSDGIHVVSAKGGIPRVIARAPPFVIFTHPTFLDDAEHFLVTRMTLGSRERTIIALSLRGGKEQPILHGASNPTYTTNDDLAFVAGDVLFVQKFDSRTLQLRGERSAIAQPIGSESGIALYSIARAGSTLMYQIHGSRSTDLLLVDRSGREMPTKVPTGEMVDPYLSRDGSRAAFIITSDGGAADVWQLDTTTGIPLRLTSGDASRSAPIWSPDGREMVFTANGDLFVMPVNGGPSRVLLTNSMHKFASDWSPDGRFIIFTQVDPETHGDVNAISVADGRVFPVVNTRFSEHAGRFSPDGQWITYVSSESGKPEIYVQRFPGGEQKTRVSPNGGLMPVWSPDGRELFYITRDQLVSLEVRHNREFRVSPPRTLFDLPALTSLNAAYAPLPDGQRFLVTKRADTSQSRVMNVVLNWRALRQ